MSLPRLLTFSTPNHPTATPAPRLLAASRSIAASGFLDDVFVPSGSPAWPKFLGGVATPPIATVVPLGNLQATATEDADFAEASALLDAALADPGDDIELSSEPAATLRSPEDAAVKARASALAKAGAAKKKAKQEARKQAEAKAEADAAAKARTLYKRRGAWFISQFSSRYNTNEDAPNNGNCGPTSLTMVAKAFGKIRPSAAQADAAIEETRRRMGDGNDEYEGTSIAGIVRGAKSYGLDAQSSFNAGPKTIAAELAKGRLVIVHGVYIRRDGTYSDGGHYFVVTKIENGKAYLNDPAYSDGPRVVSVGALMASIRKRGTMGMISVGS